jgi:hypothetical protein
MQTAASTQIEMPLIGLIESVSDTKSYCNKHVSFSPTITVYTVPRNDPTRYGFWLDYCIEDKKCKINGKTFISRRYSQSVLCCCVCGHVKTLI